MAVGLVLNKYKAGSPADAIYIGRSSSFGNEYVIGKDGDRNQVCDLHDRALAADRQRLQSLDRLTDKNVLCFCSPCRCHGDTLVLLAAMTMQKRLEWAEMILSRPYPGREEGVDVVGRISAAVPAESQPRQRRMF